MPSQIKGSRATKNEVMMSLDIDMESFYKDR